MHISCYSQLLSLLYQVTQKKNYFEWGFEQQQAFEHIKQEIACVVALGPGWTRKRYSTLQLGNMVSPGAFSRKHHKKIEVDH